MSSKVEKIPRKSAVFTWTTSSVEVDTRSFPHFTFRAEVSSTPSGNGFTSNDEGGRKIAEELNKLPISIKIDLAYTGPHPGSSDQPFLYELGLLMDAGERNVLEKLWERYGEGIKISVYLQPKMKMADTGPLISAEGMTISPGKYTCTSKLAPFNQFLPDYIHLLGKEEWALTIKLHIPPSQGHVDCKFCDCSSSSSLTQFDEFQTLQMLEEQVFCDLTITAANGAQVRAHRTCLAAASTVLREELENKMKDDDNDEPFRAGMVDMHVNMDISEKGVKAFLRYIYGRELDLVGLKGDILTASELLYAACRYHLPKLGKVMEKLFDEVDDDEDFGAELAFKIYTTFVGEGWNPRPPSSLKSKIIRIIKLKWDQVKSSQQFRDFFKEGNGANWENAITLIDDIVKSQIEYCDKPTEQKTLSAPEKQSAQGLLLVVSDEMKEEIESSWHRKSEEDPDSALATDMAIRNPAVVGLDEVKVEGINADDADDNKADPDPVALLLPGRPTEVIQRSESEFTSAVSLLELETKSIPKDDAHPPSQQNLLEKRISELETALFHAQMEIKHYRFKTAKYKEEICTLKMTMLPGQAPKAK